VLAAFLDELSSGVLPLSAPEIEARFGLSAGAAAGWTLAALMPLALVLEPPLFALADGRRRRPIMLGAFVAIALCCVLAAVAPSFWTLLVAVALFGPALGCAGELAQASLVDRSPDARERALARWSLAGTLGDLAAPALLAALAALGLGYRAALALVAAVTLFIGAWIARAVRDDEPRSSDDDDDDAEATLRDGVRAAWSSPRLALWAGACVLCSFLDETLVAFGASYMHHDLGASAGVRGVAFAAWTAGGLVGLTAADRVLARAAPLRVLALSSALCAAAHAAWLFSPSPAGVVAGLFAVGLTSSVHYPIVKAQAYAAAPGRSGLVNAVVSVLVPFDIVVPIALAFIADRVGARAAMLALLAQPLGLLAVAAVAITSSRRARPSGGNAR